MSTADQPGEGLDLDAIAEQCPRDAEDAAGWARVGRHVPALMETVRRLRHANQRLNAEVPHLLSAGADSDEFVVTVRPGHELMVAVADEMAKLLAAEAGHNYVEWDLKPAGQPHPYRLILVRPGGRSPHELRQAADAVVARVRALLDDPAAVVEVVRAEDPTASPIRAVAVADVQRVLDAPEPSGGR